MERVQRFGSRGTILWIVHFARKDEPEAYLTDIGSDPCQNIYLTTRLPM